LRLSSQTPKAAKLTALAALGYKLLFLFNDYALDTDRRELRSRGALIDVEPQVFDLLVHLIEQRDHVVSKDDLIASVWKGRIVSDSTLDSRVNAARKAVGDSGEKQDTIRTIARKGLRFVASVRRAEEQPEVGTTRPVIAEKQKISFCRSKDNVSLALASVGTGTPLIKTANWLTHLEFDWESPVWSPLLHWLASKSRLVRYDGRGTGLSDMNIEEISFSSFVSDFDAVADATGFEKFNILGISQGAAIAIDYVVRHPERVSKLIIAGGYGQGRNIRGEQEKGEIFLSMLRHGWGDEHSPFMRAFASVFIPNGSAEQIRWFAELQRMTTSAENADRIRRACDNIDVTNLLPQVKVPTLILHSRHDAVVPHEQGRLMAISIPNARFVTLESENHVLLAGEPAWAKFLDEVEAFLEA
jgi:pimeloyl-ACP methyl ester carboxylesterase/DNA-binding winged helix-turn-helix (wHTH) protein